VRYCFASIALAAILTIPDAASAQLSLKPCSIPDVSGSVECATFQVFEDREARKGRRLHLNVVVLRATAPTASRPDPLFVLQGGPGQGVTQLADFYGRLFAGVRQSRDLVFVDLRGTGKSNILSCPQIAQPDSTGHFDADLLPPLALQACRAALEARADLTKYTTTLAIADLDELRATLGYDRINLYGTSYGTYAAQVYLRDFPTRVRTVSMKGVVPYGQLAPIHHARDGELSWHALVKRCAADARCHASFPSLDDDLRSTVTRLARQPATLAVTTPEGRPATLSLSAGLFGETIRNLLYTPETAARLPALLRRAAAGDVASIAPAALRTRTALGGTDLAAGFFLSTTCSEGIPLVSASQVSELTAATFAGDYRLQQQIRACESWPRGPLYRGHLAPITSQVPILMISGELDPVTPPSRGMELLKRFPRATHVVVANNGHPFGKLEGCGNVLITHFIESGGLKGVDAACANRIPPTPFEIP
jgi:pimeloyl-ACP methyl ester carboxylesterase